MVDEVETAEFLDAGGDGGSPEGFVIGLDESVDDLTRLFPADEWDDYEFGIVHGAVFAAVYHMIRADADRKGIFDTLEGIVANEVIREFADKHGVHAPVEVGVKVDATLVE